MRLSMYIDGVWKGVRIEWLFLDAEAPKPYFLAQAAAEATAALAASSDDLLLGLVRAGALPHLKVLLEIGNATEMAAAARAIAALSRHPSVHNALFSTGICTTLLAMAGSKVGLMFSFLVPIPYGVYSAHRVEGLAVFAHEPFHAFPRVADKDVA
jgi:hypothetical protein